METLHERSERILAAIHAGERPAWVNPCPAGWVTEVEKLYHQDPAMRPELRQVAKALETSVDVLAWEAW